LSVFPCRFHSTGVPLIVKIGKNLLIFIIFIGVAQKALRLWCEGPSSPKKKNSHTKGSREETNSWCIEIHEMCGYTGNKWSDRSGNKRFKGNFGSHASKTFNRVTTKESCTWNMKCVVIPVIIGATGVVTKGLKETL
jgi:hypothetical protein